MSIPRPSVVGVFLPQLILSARRRHTKCGRAYRWQGEATGFWLRQRSYLIKGNPASSVSATVCDVMVMRGKPDRSVLVTNNKACGDAGAPEVEKYSPRWNKGPKARDFCYNKVAGFGTMYTPNAREIMEHSDSRSSARKRLKNEST
ncbi:hypothetical protein B0H16DRAFT_1687906 [Mycena metata]|uniref:Uncharacterized protein n=1 Tax=Mycena metata TaxID=1033252 RepID=A0AAD7JF70_9AGAR|nr:hypothetical protein B0H16DRAFT_1687906 [Mycena metata]